MDFNLYDVIVVGAGASGLMAAYELTLAGKKVAVIEARDRLGGRIHTITNHGFSLPVELGAEFIHGKLELTKTLLKKAGISTTDVKGDLWQKNGHELTLQEDFIEDYSDLEKKCKELKHDIPVSRFIQEYLKEDRFEELRFSLKNYVEGYYAADPSKASTYALCEELTTSDDEQYRINGGYIQLMRFLAEESLNRGCSFHYSSVVEQINWSRNKQEVITSSGLFQSGKVLITVPLGVLQQEKIRFNPGLIQKMNAARQLGFGPVIKIILEFREAFWKKRELTGKHDLDNMSFLFSREKIPTWWTIFPLEIPQLTGWLAGPKAEALKNNTNEELLHKSLLALHQIFDIGISFLEQQLKAWEIYNWAVDEFNLGGYAFEVVNGPLIRQTLIEPVSNNIYFAGEALFDGLEIGTVEAALVSGKETAHNMIVSF
jgi:monoamine oxidase